MLNITLNNKTGSNCSAAQLPTSSLVVCCTSHQAHSDKCHSPHVEARCCFAALWHTPSYLMHTVAAPTSVTTCCSLHNELLTCAQWLKFLMPTPDGHVVAMVM